MANDRDSSEIGDRFRIEQEYIERYVRLLGLKSTVHDQQVVDLNQILKRCEISQLPTRPRERVGTPYSDSEIRNLLATIPQTQREVFQAILGFERRLDDVPSIPDEGPAAGYTDLFGDWVDLFFDRLSDDPDDDDIDNEIRYALKEAQEADQELDEGERIPPEALKALLTCAVEFALHSKFAQRLDELVYTRTQFEEIEVMARVAASNAEINIVRQGFLLLMTAFDAAVFDLTRIAFRHKFFDLIAVFGKNEKISLEAIGEAGNFEVFRAQTIEDLLKRRYLKELLGILRIVSGPCVDEAAGDSHVQLVELVLRRNAHVHNRGIVDERYLELDPATGKPRYNLQNFALGAHATIDIEYFQNAIRLCNYCINQLVKWARS